MTGVHDHGAASARETSIAFRVEGMDINMEATTSFLLITTAIIFTVLHLMIIGVTPCLLCIAHGSGGSSPRICSLLLLPMVAQDEVMISQMKSNGLPRS